MATPQRNLSLLRRAGKVLQVQQAGLLLVILLLGCALTLFSGSHVDPLTGRQVNNFLNANTLLQTWCWGGMSSPRVATWRRAVERGLRERMEKSVAAVGHVTR